MTFHTFVICAYGESPYLEACVRSLRKQTVRSGILCVTSTPNSHISRIMGRYAVPVLIRQAESDIQEDWNFALSHGDSQFVTIAHQDDMYGRHYVEELEKAFRRWPDMTLFTTASVTVRHGRLERFSLKNIVKKCLRLPLRLTFLADREWVKMGALKLGNPIMCPSCAYRRDHLPDPIFHSELRYALDWDCMTDLAKWPGRFVCVEKPLLFYRVHEGATTGAWIRDHRREQEERRMFARFWPEPVVEALMRFYKTAYGEYGQTREKTDRSVQKGRRETERNGQIRSGGAGGK